MTGPFGNDRQERGRIAALEGEVERLRKALAVPKVWTVAEADGMMDAFHEAQAKHGDYESLFAVAAWLLRHRQKRALLQEDQG